MACRKTDTDKKNKTDKRSKNNVSPGDWDAKQDFRDDDAGARSDAAAG
jgi:hypothetical protein